MVKISLDTEYPIWKAKISWNVNNVDEDESHVITSKKPTKSSVPNKHASGSHIWVLKKSEWGWKKKLHRRLKYIFTQLATV